LLYLGPVLSFLRHLSLQARERAYEDLLQRAGEYQKTEKLESMFFPQGPRLGNVVVQAEDVRKGFGDRLLYEGLTFSLPPGGTFPIKFCCANQEDD
jgi:sulfate-transporting ATPase